MKLCECGCGQPTLLAQESRTNRGHVKGIPLRFIHGHQSGPPQRRRDWPAEIVAFLVREKRAGREFEESWQRAVKAHPPRSRDMGDAEPTLFGAETSVFEFSRGVVGGVARLHVERAGPREGVGPVPRGHARVVGR
jgi:hypothetical protein